MALAQSPQLAEYSGYVQDSGEGRWTVVTGRYGALRGERIVRGREAECRAHYRTRAAARARPDAGTRARALT